MLFRISILPGLIETGMTTYTFERAKERGTLGKVGQLNPMRRCAFHLQLRLSSSLNCVWCRFGIAEEIAPAVLFLASGPFSDRARPARLLIFLCLRRIVLRASRDTSGELERSLNPLPGCRSMGWRSLSMAAFRARIPSFLARRSDHSPNSQRFL